MVRLTAPPTRAVRPLRRRRRDGQSREVDGRVRHPYLPATRTPRGRIALAAVPTAPAGPRSVVPHRLSDAAAGCVAPVVAGHTSILAGPGFARVSPMFRPGKMRGYEVRLWSTMW